MHMLRRFKILIIFGTRPEAIKMAPLVQELARYEQEIEAKVVVTGQHREMLDQVLRLFAIQPAYDLNVMQPGQTLAGITNRVLSGLDRIITEEKPDLVLVHGDTTTTFAAALAAFYHRIPVGHVEAGLRTHNKYSPYPEEMNRRLTAVLADLHFAPTQTACDNLQQEGIGRERIFITGNTVIDALLATIDEEYSFTDPLLKDIDFCRRRVLLVTTHRRENWGGPLRNVYLALKDIIARYEDVEVVFPVHKNPVVRQPVEEILGGLPRVRLIEPLDYKPFVNLMARSYCVLTDSGGLQEEAPSLGKPVLVLRDTTERPEALAYGTVLLVGTGREAVVEAVEALLNDAVLYHRMASAINPYGDGRASQRIAQAIRYFFKIVNEPPEEFIPASNQKKVKIFSPSMEE